MFPYIVADIGGTNARFALVTGVKEATGKNQQQFVIEHINVLNGADYAKFEDALQAYISLLSGIESRAACVAIAGPIDGDNIKMTNLSWSFSKQDIKTRFGFDAFDVINDFAAVAVGTSELTEKDLIEIKAGSFNAHANKAVLGAGTGLGVAGLAYNGGSWLPIPSEAGHVNMAPATKFEAEVITAGIDRFGYVSAETYVSGPGLVNLYLSVCDVLGVKSSVLEPKDVTANALSGKDSECIKTLQTFCCFLGTVSSNLVLTYGGKGGVYLSGGVVPRFVDFLKDSDFAERFSNKGIMSHYVEDVPVYLIGYDHIALLGAATWLDQMVN